MLQKCSLGAIFDSELSLFYYSIKLQFESKQCFVDNKEIFELKVDSVGVDDCNDQSVEAKKLFEFDLNELVDFENLKLWLTIKKNDFILKQLQLSNLIDDFDSLNFFYENCYDVCLNINSVKNVLLSLKISNQILLLNFYFVINGTVGKWILSFFYKVF